MWMGEGTFQSNGMSATSTTGVFAVRDGQVLALNSKCHD